MSLGLRLSFSIVSGSFTEAMKESESDVARAATNAMDKVVGIVKADGRAAIAAAGFSRRWQNALRVTRYPNKRGSIAMDPSAYVFHKIEYAGVFEDGATIAGKPFLWLPLKSTPKKVGGKKVNPDDLGSEIGKPLVSFTSRNGTPLLGVKVEVRQSQLNRPLNTISLAALKRGNTGKKAEGSSLFRLVPLFFGLRETHIPKKLNIRAVCQKANGRIPALYAAELANELRGQ